MQRWKLTIEYDGTPYMGWQRQHHGPSVQQTIEDALTKFTEISDPCLNVAGRTDAGVHAVGQVAHIDIEKPLTAREMQNATNHHMGYAPIAILKAEAVDNSFHARFDAKKRYYRYRITCNHQAPPKLDAMRSWHIRNDLDIEAMRAGALHLLGHHDFSSFRAAQCQSDKPQRTIDDISISEFTDPLRPGRQICIDVAAKSFLHHQIRNFAGSLKAVGEGRLAADDIKTILETRDRTKADMTAPAHGLYFVRVDY
jgi:tRNA pseudouridine38-40 synthase